MKIRAAFILLLSTLLSNCNGLIHTESSDLVIVQQETVVLSDAQISSLIPRLQGYATNHGMSVDYNGVPGLGSSFSLQVNVKKDKFFMLVTSPFNPKTFIFALYKDRNYHKGKVFPFNDIIQTVRR